MRINTFGMVMVKAVGSITIPGLYLLIRRRWVAGFLFLAAVLYSASAAITDVGVLNFLSTSEALIAVGFIYLGNFIVLSARAAAISLHFQRSVE